MSEDEAKQAAEEDAKYFWQLLNDGVPLEIAVRMVCTRIMARLMAEATKRPKEPWQ